VYRGWGTADQLHVGRMTVDQSEELGLPTGSMGPKVQAACRFVRRTGREAVIGALADIADMVAGGAGTRVVTDERRPG